MNIYQTEFTCICPVNKKQIEYLWTIETDETIMVEEMIEYKNKFIEGLHEEMADELSHAFPGEQILIADHHGVLITTLR